MGEMLDYSELENKKLHHAYGVAGDVAVLAVKLREFFLKNLGVAVIGNPDFFHETFEMLTIDDARRIQGIHASKAFADAVPRIFLIELYGATREAQNALLKIIEEPLPGNHFFLVMPSFDILLPTLRSRLHIVAIKSSSYQSTSQSDNVNDASADFIGMSLKDRIVFVDAMATRISEGTAGKHEAIDFINRLESSIYIFSKSSKNLAEKIAVFEVIARARSYMNDRAPSVKMLLEYVALSI